MKIIIPTIGFRGDLQPYINLAQGLRDAGYDATLATNPTLCPLVEQHGIRAMPVGQPVDMSSEAERLLEKWFFRNSPFDKLRAPRGKTPHFGVWARLRAPIPQNAAFFSRGRQANIREPEIYCS
jgi:hypothetical protein